MKHLKHIGFFFTCALSVLLLFSSIGSAQPAVDLRLPPRIQIVPQHLTAAGKDGRIVIEGKQRDGRWMAIREVRSLPRDGRVTLGSMHLRRIREERTYRLRVWIHGDDYGPVVFDLEPDRVFYRFDMGDYLKPPSEPEAKPLVPRPAPEQAPLRLGQVELDLRNPPEGVNLENIVVDKTSDGQIWEEEEIQDIGFDAERRTIRIRLTPSASRLRVVSLDGAFPDIPINLTEGSAHYSISMAGDVREPERGPEVPEFELPQRFEIAPQHLTVSGKRGRIVVEGKSKAGRWMEIRSVSRLPGDGKITIASVYFDRIEAERISRLRLRIEGDDYEPVEFPLVSGQVDYRPDMRQYYRKRAPEVREDGADLKLPSAIQIVPQQLRSSDKYSRFVVQGELKDGRWKEIRTVFGLPADGMISLHFGFLDTIKAYKISRLRLRILGYVDVVFDLQPGQNYYRFNMRDYLESYRRVVFTGIPDLWQGIPDLWRSFDIKILGVKKGQVASVYPNLKHEIRTYPAEYDSLQLRVWDPSIKGIKIPHGTEAEFRFDLSKYCDLFTVSVTDSLYRQAVKGSMIHVKSDLLSLKYEDRAEKGAFEVPSFKGHKTRYAIEITRPGYAKAAFEEDFPSRTGSRNVVLAPRGIQNDISVFHRSRTDIERSKIILKKVRRDGKTVVNDAVKTGKIKRPYGLKIRGVELDDGLAASYNIKEVLLNNTQVRLKPARRAASSVDFASDMQWSYLNFLSIRLTLRRDPVTVRIPFKVEPVGRPIVLRKSEALTIELQDMDPLPSSRKFRPAGYSVDTTTRMISVAATTADTLVRVALVGHPKLEELYWTFPVSSPQTLTLKRRWPATVVLINATRYMRASMEILAQQLAGCLERLSPGSLQNLSLFVSRGREVESVPKSPSGLRAFFSQYFINDAVPPLLNNDIRNMYEAIESRRTDGTRSRMVYILPENPALVPSRKTPLPYDPDQADLYVILVARDSKWSSSAARDWREIMDRGCFKFVSAGDVRALLGSFLRSPDPPPDWEE